MPDGMSYLQPPKRDQKETAMMHLLSPIMFNKMGGCTQKILLVNETPTSLKIRNLKTHELNRKTQIICCPLFSVLSGLVADSKSLKSVTARLPDPLSSHPWAQWGSPAQHRGCPAWPLVDQA